MAKKTVEELRIEAAKIEAERVATLKKEAMRTDSNFVKTAKVLTPEELGKLTPEELVIEKARIEKAKADALPTYEEGLLIKAEAKKAKIEAAKVEAERVKEMNAKEAKLKEARIDKIEDIVFDTLAPELDDFDNLDLRFTPAELRSDIHNMLISTTDRKFNVSKKNLTDAEGKPVSAEVAEADKKKYLGRDYYIVMLDPGHIYIVEKAFFNAIAKLN